MRSWGWVFTIIYYKKLNCVCVCIYNPNIFAKLCSCVRSSPLFVCPFNSLFMWPFLLPLYVSIHPPCSCVRSSPLFVCPFIPHVSLSMHHPCSCVHSSNLFMWPFIPPVRVSVCPPCLCVRSSPLFVCPFVPLLVCLFDPTHPFVYLFVPPVCVSVHPPVRVSVHPPFICPLLSAHNHVSVTNMPPAGTSFSKTVHRPVNKS